MNRRMFKGILVVGVLNFLIFMGCGSVVRESMSSGPEGVGSAFMAMASLGLGFILTGFGLKQLYAEFGKNAVTRRTVIVILVAALPLLAWIFWKHN